MNLRKIFAENVRLERKRQGLSQEQLALRADISRSYVYNIESADFSVSLDKVERIAVVLEVQPWELLRPVSAPTSIRTPRQTRNSRVGRAKGGKASR